MRRVLLPILLVVLAACTGLEGEASTTSRPADASTAASSAPPSTTTEPETASTATTAADQSTTTTTKVPALLGLAYDRVAGDFGYPIFVNAPPGDERLFVASKDGLVHLVRDGAKLVEPFLDIRELTRNQGEQGLLGMAFHPDYTINGLFYVHYSDRHGDTKVAEYRVGSNPDLADPESARLIFSTTQPAGNHNGGMLAFGPDGFLYIALGDGGGANDRFGNGQRPDTVLGTLLRIDVDAQENGNAYAVPADNPFNRGDGAAEVWAFGLRNPWRFAFDGDLLYIADVGQNRWEEIDVVAAAQPGVNYGWPIMEGTNCFSPSSGCETGGLQLPVVEYSHSEGCSVTGGSVYRGRSIPELDGRYLYSDYCSGWLRSFVYQGGAAADLQDHTEDVGALSSVTSFGTDGLGEVYVTTAGGDVWKLVAER